MKRIIVILLIICLVIATVIGFTVYLAIFDSAVSEKYSLYIPANTSIKEAKDILINANKLKSERHFKICAKIMKWNEGHVKAGHYVLSPELTNRDVINLIRSGRRTPINLTINNVRKIDELASLVQDQLMMDSVQFSNYLYSFDWDEGHNYDSNTALCLFIPNTYELYWSSTPEQLLSRMKKEHAAFWNESRQQNLTKLGMTTNEVYTLASIVEKESNSQKERPIIASLYLNRLRIGMPLQADPTVVFANNDFGLKRVLFKHLEKDSPYNTYKNAGLPPGPIYMSSISSIDAVLNASETDYLYMCAKPNHPGEHSFASNSREHQRNAAAYHRWLNQRGIN